MPSLLSTVVTCVFFALNASAQQPSQRLRVLVPLESSASFDHAITDAVKQFNSGHPHFQVELSKGGSYFKTLQAIIAAHYANDLPDLALVNSADVPTLSALGVVQPLSDTWVSAKKPLPNLSNSARCKGEPCSLPFQRRVPVWFFNRELLFKLGQDTDRIPMTWPRLSQLSQKMTRPGELWGVAIPETGESAITRWTAIGFPTSNLSPETTTDWVGKLWASPGSWLPGNPSSEEVTRWFLEQRSVVLLGGLDQLPYLKTNATFRYGTVLPDGELSWFGTDFVMMAKGNTADIAREFLDFLYRPEIALQLFRAAPTLPVTRLEADNAAWKKEIDAQPVIKAAITRKLRPVGLEKIAPQVREEYSNVVWEAVEQSPEVSQRPAKALELKGRLQKILSTNTR